MFWFLPWFRAEDGVAGWESPQGWTSAEHSMCDPSIKTQLPTVSQCHSIPVEQVVSECSCSTLLMFCLKLGVLIPPPLTGPVSLSRSAESEAQQDVLAFLENSSKCWTVFFQRNFEQSVAPSVTYSTELRNSYQTKATVILGSKGINQFVVPVLHGCKLLLRMGGCCFQSDEGISRSTQTLSAWSSNFYLLVPNCKQEQLYPFCEKYYCLTGITI